VKLVLVGVGGVERGEGGEFLTLFSQGWVGGGWH